MQYAIQVDELVRMPESSAAINTSFMKCQDSLMSLGPLIALM